MKLSGIALALGVTAGVQQIDSALTIANSFSYESSQREFSHFASNGISMVVNGFPKISSEADSLEFKIFHARVVSYGYKMVTLFILAYDFGQAGRLLANFHTVVSRQVMKDRPESGGVKKHLFEEDIAPDEVVEIASKSEVIYTLFMGS